MQAEVIGHVHERDVQHCEGGEETTRWAASQMSCLLPVSVGVPVPYDRRAIPARRMDVHW